MRWGSVPTWPHHWPIWCGSGCVIQRSVWRQMIASDSVTCCDTYRGARSLNSDIFPHANDPLSVLLCLAAVFNCLSLLHDVKTLHLQSHFIVWSIRSQSDFTYNQNQSVFLKLFTLRSFCPNDFKVQIECGFNIAVKNVICNCWDYKMALIWLYCEYII